MNVPLNVLYGSIAFIVQLYARKYAAEDRKTYFPEPPVDYSLPKIETFDFIIGISKNTKKTVLDILNFVS